MRDERSKGEEEEAARSMKRCSKETTTAAVLGGPSVATVLVGAQCCGSQGHALGPPCPRRPPGNVTAVTPAARSFFEISAAGGQISEEALLKGEGKLNVDKMRGNGHRDISDDDVFAEALAAATRATWVHAAPATEFTDDRGMHAEAARRTAAVAQAAADSGNDYTIEGPSASYLWELKPFRRLAAAPGAQKLDLNLDGVKVSILTNAAWAEIAEARVAEQGHLATKASFHRALVQASGEMRSHACPRGSSDGSTWTRAGFFGNVLLRAPAGHTSATAAAAAFNFGRGSVRAGQESKKEKREEENFNAIGGLRNPNQAAARSPQLRAVGRRLRTVLETLVRKSVAEQRTAENLGTPAAGDFSDTFVAEARAAVAVEFGTTAAGTGMGYQGELFGRLLAEAGDAETELKHWINDGFPLGITRPIVPVGVFPGVDHDTAAIEASRVFGEMLARNPEPHDEHKNYKSFAEEAAAADEDLERIVGEGFAEKFESAAAVVQRFGAFVPAKVAVQAKRPAASPFRLIV